MCILPVLTQLNAVRHINESHLQFATCFKRTLLQKFCSQFTMHVKSAEQLISYFNKTPVPGWDGQLPEEMSCLRKEAHNYLS